MTQRVGIVGAGILGRLLAFELASDGFEVTLYDRDQPDSENACSWVGAGMLAPVAELDVAEPEIADWGLQALTLWPGILARLGKPVFFQQEGSLVIAHRQDAADLERFKRRLNLKCKGHHLYRELDSNLLAVMEPELGNRFSHGLFFADEGQLEPRQLLPALLHAGRREGVFGRFGSHVETVLPGQVHTATGVELHDWVVDARGMGAQAQLPSLRGVRGERIRLFAPEVRLSRPVRLMHPRYPLYIVPRPNHEFLIGATTIESQQAKAVTLRSALELLSAAYSVHPGFAEAEILDMRAQIRPALPDHLPRIYCEPGLLRINGLYRHGFLVSPVLVRAALTYLKTARMEENDILWEVGTHA